MKVIAKVSESRYMCEVSHEELEKFFNKYYGNLSKLTVGQEVNLGQGYDFSVRIESACKSMVDASREFGRAQSVMTDYAMAIARSAGQEGGIA
jgi:hypothetical protein